MVTGVRLSLWRAVALYRVIALLFCLYLVFRWRDIYARPAIAFAVAAAMIAVTAVVCWLAVRGRAHRRGVVAVDLVITVLLTLASISAQTPRQRLSDGMPTLTTVWAAGPVIETAFLLGWSGGAIAALVQLGAAMLVREGYDGRTLTSGLLLLIAGATTGYVATLVVRAERELAAAVAARAALAERERLARSVHDGTLQVLGLLTRRGREAGGEWTRLADAAAEQEFALRRLMTSVPQREPGRRDLIAALRALETDRVTVATPGGELPLDPHTTDELTAAVAAALDNVGKHAGPDARAWVFLDHHDGAVEITVRDDGCGMDDERPNVASAAGRLGIAQSIRGRITDLGGEVRLTSAPGKGTTVDITVPR